MKHWFDGYHSWRIYRTHLGCLVRERITVISGVAHIVEIILSAARIDRTRIKAVG